MLIVDAESRGIENVLVFLYLTEGETLPPEHPDYAAMAKAEVKMVVKDCRLQPHIAISRAGQNFLVTNEDPIGHSINANWFENEVNHISPHDKLTYEDLVPERAPVKVNCAIHGFVHGYLAVLDHPYATLSGYEGTFTIHNLPVGKYRFRAWQETTGYLRETHIGEQNVDWVKGYEIEIKPGENNLGEIVVPASEFE